MDNTAKRYAEFVNGIKSESIVVSTKSMQELFSYIDQMEENIKTVKSELEILKKQSINLQNEPKPEPEAKVKLDEFIKKIEELIQKMQQHVMEYKESILEKSEEIKNYINEKNLEGLNKVADMLNIKSVCVNISEELMKGAVNAENFATKLDNLSKTVENSKEKGKVSLAEGRSSVIKLKAKLAQPAGMER